MNFKTSKDCQLVEFSSIAITLCLKIMYQNFSYKNILISQ